MSSDISCSWKRLLALLVPTYPRSTRNRSGHDWAWARQTGGGAAEQLWSLSRRPMMTCMGRKANLKKQSPAPTMQRRRMRPSLPEQRPLMLLPATMLCGHHLVLRRIMLFLSATTSCRLRLLLLPIMFFSPRMSHLSFACSARGDIVSISIASSKLLRRTGNGAPIASNTAYEAIALVLACLPAIVGSPKEYTAGAL